MGDCRIKSRKCEQYHLFRWDVFIPGHVLCSGLATWRKCRVRAYVGAKPEAPVRVSGLTATTRLSVAHFSRTFRVSFQQNVLDRQPPKDPHCRAAAYAGERGQDPPKVDPLVLEIAGPASEAALACRDPWE
jgi:hypothetical protein